jgi:hypothetical protein
MPGTPSKCGRIIAVLKSAEPTKLLEGRCSIQLSYGRLAHCSCLMACADCFIEQLEAFLTLEQRRAWCAVGLVDITSSWT